MSDDIECFVCSQQNSWSMVDYTSCLVSQYWSHQRVCLVPFPSQRLLSLQTNTVHWVTDPAKLQWNFFLKIQQPSSRKDNTFSFFQESFQKFILNIYDVKKKSSIGSWQVFFSNSVCLKGMIEGKKTLEFSYLLET